MTRRAVPPAFCPLVALPGGSTPRAATTALDLHRAPAATSTTTSLRRRRRTTPTACMSSSSSSSSFSPSSPCPFDAPQQRDSPSAAGHGPSAISQMPPPPPPPQSPPPGGSGGYRTADYHANVGSVIDALRADYPALLTEAPALEVFREDMVFTDASGNRLVGKDAYRTVLFMLRLHVRLVLSNADLSIVSLRYHDSDGDPSGTASFGAFNVSNSGSDGMFPPVGSGASGEGGGGGAEAGTGGGLGGQAAVHVRWRLRAMPRAWTSAATRVERCGTVVDGLCVYYLDHAGRVAHHKIETVVRADRPLMVRSLFERVLAVGQIGVVAEGASGAGRRRVPVPHVADGGSTSAAVRSSSTEASAAHNGYSVATRDSNAALRRTLERVEWTPLPLVAAAAAAAAERADAARAVAVALGGEADSRAEAQSNAERDGDEGDYIMPYADALLQVS